MDIYTTQINNKGALEQQGLVVIDTTVKTGNKCFAPTWRMVLDYKSGILSEEQYIREFTQLMEASLQQNRGEWEKLFSLPKVVLCCYCPPSSFCHRHLLVDIIERELIPRGDECLRCGEV